MSRISLQMYTLRDYMKTEKDLAETLKKVRAAGYENVQISIPAYTTAEEVKSMLDGNGLKADSVFAPCMTVAENLNGIVRDAKIMQTNFIRTDSIPREMSYTPEGYEAFAKTLNADGEMLHSFGLKIYYHFHAFEFINFPDGRRGIDILLNDTNPDCVGFQPDIFWLAAAGVEPSFFLRRFKGRAVYMHVKDYAITSREGILESVPRIFAPVGQGNLNWPAILSAAEDTGIRLYVVEQDICQKDVMESVADSFRALRAMGIE